MALIFKWSGLKSLGSFFSRQLDHWREERSPGVVIFLEIIFGFFAILGAAASVYLELDSLKDKWPNLRPWVVDLRTNFGGVHTIMNLVCVVVAHLYGKLLRMNQRLADRLEQANAHLARATLPAGHCDLFAGVFAHWGNATNGDQFRVSAHSHRSYITIHSEVLYYTMLCSMIESLRDKITSMRRAHIFIPGAPSSLFLSEILKVLPEGISQERYYIFRNDLLDYDRDSLRGQGDETQQHLWSTFVIPSRILFRDAGAHYGYYKSYSPTRISIWDESFDWPDGFNHTCERLMIEARDHGLVTAIVERDPATFEFKEARISVGDETAAIAAAGWPSTLDYFNRLQEAVTTGSSWMCADNWEHYPLEVSLVSGTEMELYARPGVTLWAVDDFDLGNFFSEPGKSWSQMDWLKEGSPRYLAWSKSIAACLKKARVCRLFLADGALFNAPTGHNVDRLFALFATMAIQHRYLSVHVGDATRGEVRSLVKSRITKIDSVYPDYAILARSEKILGGVVWKPYPRYVSPNDERLLSHLKGRWEVGQSFPLGFVPVKDFLLGNAKPIAQAITRVEVLNDREITPEEVDDRQQWLENALTSVAN